MSPFKPWRCKADFYDDFEEAQKSYRRLLAVSSKDQRLSAVPFLSWLMGDGRDFDLKRQVRLPKRLERSILNSEKKRAAAEDRGGLGTKSSFPIASRYWECQKYRAICIWTNVAGAKIESRFPTFFSFLRHHHIPWIFRKVSKAKEHRRNLFFDLNLIVLPVSQMRVLRRSLDDAITGATSVFVWDRTADVIPFHFRHGLAVFDEIWVANSDQLIDCNRYIEVPKYEMKFLQGALSQRLEQVAWIELKAKFSRGKRI